jgi:hypothetical protein
MSTVAQKKQDKHESSVVEGMANARKIAMRLFDTQADINVVHEIFDYLAVADEADFIADLERVIGHAKKIYETTAPTGEQVFGLFERIFGEDE